MTSWLLTGGTGSLGKALLRKLKGNITVLSRSEAGQEPLMMKYPKVKFILGDVADKYIVERAMKGIDVVIHAAAFKFLNIAESQTRQCVLTNIIGTLNVIEAAKKERVKMVVGISTDKISYARNVYGCTKHIMEKLFREANGKTKFFSVRYGNVVGSTGAVHSIWERQIKDGKPITVTDKRMTRFFFEMDEAIKLIFYAMKHAKGGETFIVKMPSYNLYELAKTFSKKIKIIGLRPGEKLHETLIADYEGEEWTSDKALNYKGKEYVCLK